MLRQLRIIAREVVMGPNVFEKTYAADSDSDARGSQRRKEQLVSQNVL